MPIVPTYQRQTQTTATPQPQVANLHYTPDHFGAGVAEVADNAIDLFAKETMKASLAMAQEAQNKNMHYANDLYNNPNNGLVTKKGKNALGQSDALINNLKNHMAETEQSLPEGEARERLRFQNQEMLERYGNQWRKYEVSEFQHYEADQFKSIKENTVHQSRGLFDDSKAFTELVANQGFVAIDQYGDAHGWSDEQRIAEKIALKEQASGLALEQNLADITDANSAVRVQLIRQALQYVDSGNAAFEAASPQMQRKYRNTLNALQAEHIAQQSQELDLQLKDIYAATDEGLEPRYIPSEAALIAAKGDIKGAQQWEDLQSQLRYGAIIAVAKNMTPIDRQDLLDDMRPSDPDMKGFARAQQEWEKMKSKFKEIDIEWNKQQAITRVAISMEKSFPLDATDSDNQTAVDEYQKRRGFDFTPEKLNQTAELIKKTSLIPSDIKSMFNAGTMSKNPDIAVPLAKLYGQVFDNNPTAVTGLNNNTAAFYTKVYQYNRAGMPAEDAVNTAYKMVYEQDENTKKMLSEKLRSKDIVKERDKAADKNIKDSIDAYFSYPNPKKPSPSNFAYLSEYKTLYDANFAATGGDPEQTKALTNAQIRKSWGVSQVNGKKEIMRYSPEAVYGIKNGSENWIKEQWENDKKSLQANMFGGERDDVNLILVPDQLTPRDQSYGIIVKQKNADGTERIAPYMGQNGLPIRFKPDQKTSPMYERLIKSQQDSLNEARARRAQVQFGRNTSDTLQPMLNPIDKENARRAQVSGKIQQNNKD